ncbi:MAG TPA: tetratricopeptide repeat protein, partial [Gemmatimonadales bacterium]|nr:tetratricopeptide repeat protein [Gemmatimonadales bacterium]
FINMSPERENEYFSDGLTEELTNALDQVAGLRVASRTSAWAFKGHEADAREIGTRLGVGLLIEGSVRKVGNRIRVTVQLVSAADGYHLWSQAYDRILTDVFALQEEIAHAVVEALARHGHGVGRRLPVRPATSVVEAYTLYLRGRYQVLKNEADAMRLAREYFEQAIELDPGYALAHAGVGHCWTMGGFEEWGDIPPLEAMPRATAAVERALAIDPTLADGHALRGIIAMLFDYDHSAAEARLARAIELQPSNLLARLWRGILRSTWGYHEEAIAEVMEAEHANPVAVRVQFVLGRCYLWAERFEEALQRFQAVLDMDDSGLALVWIARAYASTGRPDLALTTLESGTSRLGRIPMLLATRGGCLAILGREAEARAILAELRQLGAEHYVTPVHRASIHAHLGEFEAAMECLEEAARLRSGYLALSRLVFGGGDLRRLPAYSALMARVGLMEPEQLRLSREPGGRTGP